MIEKIKAHLQERFEQFKEDLHQALAENRKHLDPDIDKALFGEREDIMLLVGSENQQINQILEHRLNDRNAFDDILLCKDLLSYIELDCETDDSLRVREGQIEEVIALYSILEMPDKVKEVSDLTYFN